MVGRRVGRIIRGGEEGVYFIFGKEEEGYEGGIGGIGERC